MGNRLDFILFLVAVTAVSIAWGRINRIGYSKAIISVARLIMKYVNLNADLIQSYLVWFVYMLVGLIASIVLLAVYRVNLLRFLALNPRYFPVILVTFVAESSLTGLMMQLSLLAKPTIDIFSELTSILWVRYTLMMPGAMRVISPLCAATVEEIFFRGAVFLILINRFHQAGAYWSIFICTVLFVVQQVLQTDTFGQGLIFLVGSTSISVVGCISILYTGSFLPALLCHAAYAFVYLQLGTSTPKSKPGPGYPSF